MKNSIEHLDRDLQYLKEEFESILVEKSKLKELQKRCYELAKLNHQKMNEFNSEGLEQWKHYYCEIGNLYMTFSNTLVQIMNGDDFLLFSYFDIEKEHFIVEGDEDENQIKRYS